MGQSNLLKVLDREDKVQLRDTSIDFLRAYKVFFSTKNDLYFEFLENRLKVKIPFYQNLPQTQTGGERLVRDNLSIEEISQQQNDQETEIVSNLLFGDISSIQETSHFIEENKQEDEDDNFNDIHNPFNNLNDSVKWDLEELVIGWPQNHEILIDFLLENHNSGKLESECKIKSSNSLKLLEMIQGFYSYLHMKSINLQDQEIQIEDLLSQENKNIFLKTIFFKFSGQFLFSSQPLIKLLKVQGDVQEAEYRNELDTLEFLLAGEHFQSLQKMVSLFFYKMGTLKTEFNQWIDNLVLVTTLN